MNSIYPMNRRESRKGAVFPLAHHLDSPALGELCEVETVAVRISCRDHTEMAALNPDRKSAATRMRFPCGRQRAPLISRRDDTSPTAGIDRRGASNRRHD